MMRQHDAVQKLRLLDFNFSELILIWQVLCLLSYLKVHFIFNVKLS